jgi:N-acetylglucosamine-6-sulfatase
MPARSSRRVRAVGLALAVAAGLLTPPGVPTSAGPVRASSARMTLGPGSRPNIVLIVTDDQNADTIPRTGVRAMPNLEARLADRTEPWIRFRNAYVNTPLCCPSRATILSGQYSHHTRVETNSAAVKFDERHTVATWLHDAGYRTALIGKYLNPYPFNRGNYVPPGWDHWVAKFRGSTLHYGYTLIENGTPVTYGSDPEDYQMDVMAAKAVDFIETTPATQPFFLYFAPQSPHGPLVAAPRHRDAFRGIADLRTPAVNETDVSDKPAWIRALPLRSESQMDRLDDDRRKQMELLLAVDEGVEAVLDALEAEGFLEETIVVFMTDNGFAFGEHRWSGKRCAYAACTRSPLFVRVPGAEPHTEKRLVSNVDLASTFTSYAGTIPDIPQDGRSLVPLLTGPAPSSWRKAVLMHWQDEGGAGPDPAPFWAIRTLDFLYVELIETGEKELYDLTGVIGAADPYELDNRAGQAAYARVQAQLAARLAALKSS